MFGFWFGVNLIFLCLIIYWFIEPKFLFPQKQLNRLILMPIIAVVLFVDVGFFTLITKIKHTTDANDFTGLIIGIISVFCVSAWRFYRYGQYSILAKLPTQPTINTEQNLSSIPSNSPIIDNNTAIDNSYKKHTDDLSENNIENTEETQSNSVNPTNIKINQNEDDWQSYKQRMEQSWQETRTKIAQKSGEK